MAFGNLAVFCILAVFDLMAVLDLDLSVFGCHLACLDEFAFFSEFVRLSHCLVRKFCLKLVNSKFKNVIGVLNNPISYNYKIK